MLLNNVGNRYTFSVVRISEEKMAYTLCGSYVMQLLALECVKVYIRTYYVAQGNTCNPCICKKAKLLAGLSC